jgi:hypothetical protein
MKNFLFLDDNVDRHVAFDMMTIGCNVKHVWTADECILALMSDDPYDCVFLDHDLGGKVFVTEEKGSGSEVARFIGRSLQHDHYPRLIIIHSWNPEGALRMENYIRESGIPCRRVPFSFPG